MNHSGRLNINSPAHYKPFRRTAMLADSVIAGNQYLAQLAGQFNHNVTVIPTGLDTQPYKSTDKPTNDNKIRLVWIGSKSTLKYLRQITPALEKIGSKYDNVTLRIICDDFFDLENMPVEKRPWSQETEINDLATAGIGLAPLPDNRFTTGKCGFKILQYFAAALPVIASPVGVNQDMIEQSRAGLLAGDNSKWFDRLDTLIPNKPLQKKLAENAAEYVKQFDKKIIGQQLCETITSTLKS